MQENKNLVQEALIQMKNVEDAIAENAKGILASTMKEEINQLVKESLSEQEEEEVDVDAEMETDTDMEDMKMDDDMEADDSEMDMEFDVDMETDEPIDLTGASDEEILKVFKAMGEEDGIIVTKDNDEIHLTDNDSDNEYIVKMGESRKSKSTITEQDDTDLDAIVADLFADKSTEGAEMADMEMEPEVEMEDEEVMYEITLDEESDEELDEESDEELDEESDEMLDEESDEELDEESDEMLDEQNWEESIGESYNPKKATKPKGVGIGKGPKFSYKATKGGFKEDKKEGQKTMGTGKPKFEYKKGANMEGKSKIVKAETKESSHGMKKGDKSKTHKGDKDFTTKKGDTLKRKAFEKEETKEAARTYGMGSKEGRGLRKGITNNRNFVYGKNGVKVESLESEVSMLREKNEEYRKALNLFREKLNEVAIFNSNLAYATRLFTEHSTTKKEKINILRRFDGVESLKESKTLYKSIKDELTKGDTKPITESVENKLNNTVTSGSATNLIESKTYENPQFLRMKDLMSKIR